MALSFAVNAEELEVVELGVGLDKIRLSVPAGAFGEVGTGAVLEEGDVHGKAAPVLSTGEEGRKYERGEVVAGGEGCWRGKAVPVLFTAENS